MNVSQALTYTFSYLDDAHKNLVDVVDTVDKFVAYVDDEVFPDEDGKYSGEFHQKKIHFKEDTDDMLNDIRKDAELFLESVNCVIENKYDDKVIFSLKRYRKYMSPYKSLLKDCEHNIDAYTKLKASRLAHEDFVKASSFNSAINITTAIANLTDKIISKLAKLITDEDKEDDEKDKD